MLDHSIDTSMCNQFVGFICMLLGLIESQDWETFEKLVLSDKHEFQCLSENVSVCAEFNGAYLRDISYIHIVGNTYSLTYHSLTDIHR